MLDAGRAGKPAAAGQLGYQTYQKARRFRFWEGWWLWFGTPFRYPFCFNAVRKWISLREEKITIKSLGCFGQAARLPGSLAFSLDFHDFDRGVSEDDGCVVWPGLVLITMKLVRLSTRVPLI